MTRIQVDQALLAKLVDAGEPIAFCDSAGRILGHYLPGDQYKELLYASSNVPFSEEELSRREAETGGCSLQEIWKRLGRT